MGRGLVGNVLVVGLVALVLSCGATVLEAKDVKPTKGSVTGTVEFTGLPELEADTIARVTLEDIGSATTPKVKLGEKEIKGFEKFPFAFEVEYDRGAIKAGHTYELKVWIETRGHLLYINETRPEVISHDKPSKDLKVPVVRVRE